MALIPVHFTIAQSLRVDNASATPIPQGSVLTVTGFDSDDVPLCALAAKTDAVIGLAGDNYMFNVNESTTAHTVGITSNDLAYAADIVVSAHGETTRSMNRINDLYKDTLGSGLMTVYSGSGVFRTTRFVTASTYTPGLTVVVADHATGENKGKVDLVGGGGTLVGKILAGNVASAAAVAGGYKFPSGVPGTDVQGSMSLGNFITIQVNL